MQIGNREFQTSGKTYIMGILNVTPDSFSDGGRWNQLDVALRHGLEPGLDEKWRAFLNLQRDFERRMGTSVYSLFDECAAVTFAAES